MKLWSREAKAKRRISASQTVTPGCGVNERQGREAVNWRRLVQERENPATSARHRILLLAQKLVLDLQLIRG